MMQIDDQYEATVEEVGLYRAAGFAFEIVGKWIETDVFEVTGCKATLIDVLVALSVVVQMFDNCCELFYLRRCHCDARWLLVGVDGDRSCKNWCLTDKALGSPLEPFCNDGGFFVIGRETKSMAQICTWGILVKSG